LALFNLQMAAQDWALSIQARNIMIKVAIIEDDLRVQTDLAEVIGASGDMILTGRANSFAEGELLILSGGYDVLVCDLGLPDGDGAQLIRQSALAHPAADILVVTMFADHHKVIDAIKSGARGYVLKDQRLKKCVPAIREIRAGGSPISPIIARLLLKELQQPRGDQLEPLAEPLTERELETLHLLARGFTDAESGDILGISPHTIGTYVKNIYRKLEVRSRAEAVFEASNRGLLAKE
jgi:DNA-binding NarL/FixJ family response regulator